MSIPGEKTILANYAGGNELATKRRCLQEHSISANCNFAIRSPISHHVSSMSVVDPPGDSCSFYQPHSLPRNC